MTQSLRTGAVDICPEIPPTIWDGLKGAQKVKTVSMQSFSFHHIGINVSDNPKSGGNPLLKDLAVRQALSYAVDRQQLVNVALAGHGAARQHHPARRVRRLAPRHPGRASSSTPTRPRPRRCWTRPGTRPAAAARSAPRRTASR